MVTTAEDENPASIVGGETSATTMNSDDDVEPCRQFVAEPLSPHHGAILTTSTSAPKSRGTHAFFSDDFEQNLYNDDDDDDTMMDSMILLHASNCSSGSAGSFEEGNIDSVTSTSNSQSDTGATPKCDCSQSVLEDVKAEGDIVEEPSFETALMEAKHEVPPSPLKHLSLAFKTPRKTAHSLADFGRRRDHRSMKPQRRFDQYGRPLVHVYTEGLSTLYESHEGTSTPVHGGDQTPLRARAEDSAWEKCESDDLQQHARWNLAWHQPKHEEKACESNTSTSSSQRCQSNCKWYQSIVSPRNVP